MPQVLKRQLAGVPVYVWGILLIVAVAIGLYLRRRAAGRESSPFASDFGEAEPFPIPGTVGGGVGGGGIIGGSGDVGGGLSGEQFEAGIESLRTTISERDSTILPAPERPDIATGLLLGLDFVTQAREIFSPGIPSSLPPSTIATAAPAKARAAPGASFTWVFAKIGNLPAKAVWRMEDKSLFVQHLRARGQSYEKWHGNHASAACRVFGDCR